MATLIACQEGSVTLPQPPPMEPPPATTTIPPPINRGVPFSFQHTRGILVFPGTQASEGEILALDAQLRSLGWPRPMYHVCAETSFWQAQGIPWPSGPTPFDGTENITNLKRFLDTTASLRSQVLLDVYCTVRDARREVVPDERFFRWARTVGDIASEYDHVAIHIANEYWHGGSRLRTRSSMQTAHDQIRSGGFVGLVSSDDNFNPGDVRFDSLGGILQWPDAHPWRNPDPTPSQIEDMVRKNGTLVISEPTAYGGRSGGCCTTNRNQILKYMRACEDISGCVWMYHSVCGLGWPAQCTFDWIPGG